MTNTEAKKSRSEARLGSGVLNVGIIGCGRIAEHHLRFLSATKGVRVVGLSDTFVVNAERTAKAYSIEHVFASHEQLLQLPTLDAVHILTPPEFHFRQASDALARGVHVLLEKPCTYRADELEDLYRLAETKNVVLCPDFIQLFVPLFRRAVSLVDSGELGKVVHVDVHLGFDLIPPELQESIGLHWSFKLPGGVLHNNLTHPLYLALYWAGSVKKLTVAPRANGSLPQGLTDHLVIMIEGTLCTANVILTGSSKPDAYSVDIRCERGRVAVNFNSSTLIVERQSALPGFVKRALVNFQVAGQLVTEATKNFYNFARGRLLPYQGLESLIPKFYDSIKQRTAPPISKQLALAVAQAEEAVCAGAGRLHVDTRRRPSFQANVTHREKVLVTGAAGYVGATLTQRLVEDGYYVRALVRPLSRIETLEELGVEIFFGDVRDPQSVNAACQGVDLVVHAAAALHGSAKVIVDSAVEGTKNLALAAKQNGVKRVVYLSSMSVYNVCDLRDGEAISEATQLEELPQERGAYSLAKRRAEDEALRCLSDSSPSWTIVRPSVVVGKKYDLFSPVGKRVGNFLIGFASPKKQLRLIHVDDVARAIIEIIRNDDTKGHIFNLSNRAMAQQDYVNGLLRRQGLANLRVIYVPYWLMRGIAGVCNSINAVVSRVPRISPRRIASLYRDVEIHCEPIGGQSGWFPEENLLERLRTESQ